MTLAYTLDGATYDTLFEEARRRIIPRNREWTMHGAVDPGITILELYAALLEQRTFLADQVSEPLGRAFLALLGDRMEPARVARTVLAFDPEAPGIVPARMYMRPDRAAASRVFRTDEAVAIAPFAGFEIETVDGKRTSLANSIALLPAHGRRARTTITLRYRAPLPIDAWTNILLELEGSVAPQWSRDAVDVTPPAIVRFGAGAIDGTGGLRRSGLVRVQLPAGVKTPDGYEYRLVIETDAATFTSPPRLRALAANAVIARNRHWRSYEAPADALVPVSGQTLQLPLDEGEPLEDRVRVRFVEVTGKAEVWRTTFDLGRHADDERVVFVERERGVLWFGDGDQGRLPYPRRGSAPRVRFEVGGGAVGNIGGRVRWTQWTRGASSWTASNVVPAIEGADPERLDEARARHAAERATPKRAVTAPDHVAIATATKGVAIARAHAAIGSNPTCPTRFAPGEATVYVVPEVVGPALAEPRADAGALEAVRRTLDAARLVSHVIHVRSAVYHPARVRIDVEADPHDAAALRASVADAVRRHLDPMRWNFGAPLIPSDLLRVAQQALDDGGDGAIVRQVWIALDDEPLVACENRDIADHELVTLREIVIGLVPSGRPR